jgi:hypothetical protein
LRVATLISIWFTAHLPSQSSATFPIEAAQPRPLDVHLASMDAILPLVFPQRCACRSRPRAWRRPQIACASPEARQKDSKLAKMFDSASSFSAVVGTAVDVVTLFMALLSFVESAPRAYRLKVSNAAP